MAMIMKKYIYVFAALAAIVSCAKENTVNEEETLKTDSKNDVHELFVTIADLTDADTKAEIAVADGSFTWTVGDAIAVKTTTNDIYEFTAETGGTASARFTYTGEMNGTPAYVKYPYTADFSDTDLPTSISGLTAALTADNIRMEGTISDNAVTLSHQNALLKVTFTNVPTFASKVKFESLATGYEQSVLVSGISLGSKGTVEAYIPVKPGNYQFSVYLVDSADNYMFGRTTTKTFTQGVLKRMASTELGHVLTIDPNGWQDKNQQVYIWQVDDTDNYYSFRTYSEGGRYPYQLNILNDHAYYVILESAKHLDKDENEWLSEGIGLGVSFQMTNSGNKTETACYYLYRDITLTPQTLGTGGLKANYRTYWDNSTANYSPVKAYVWGSVKEPSEATTWSGTQATSLSGNIYYYEWSSDSYNSSIGIIFNNGSGDQSANHEYALNREYKFNY